MKEILAFGASNSKSSINKQLATFAAHQMEGDVNHDILDLNDFEMPIYSIDLEKKTGVPSKAKDFLNKIKQADGIIISFAEHNGAYTTAFKNIFDWVSRLDGNLWSEVPMMAMATSPGSRGGGSVLSIATDRFKFMGGNIVASFSLPSFNDNFNQDKGITDDNLLKEFKAEFEQFKEAVLND